MPDTSTVDVAASMFPIAPVSLLMRDQFHSDRRIGRVTAPLLIMHGDRHMAIEIHDLAVFLLEGKVRRDFGHSHRKHGELQLGHRPFSLPGKPISRGCRASEQIPVDSGMFSSSLSTASTAALGQSIDLQ